MLTNVALSIWVLRKRPKKKNQISPILLSRTKLSSYWGSYLLHRMILLSS